MVQHDVVLFVLSVRVTARGLRAVEWTGGRVIAIDDRGTNIREHGAAPKEAASRQVAAQRVAIAQVTFAQKADSRERVAPHGLKAQRVQVVRRRVDDI